MPSLEANVSVRKQGARAFKLAPAFQAGKGHVVLCREMTVAVLGPVAQFLFRRCGLDVSILPAN
jgi:hypothetical protein